MSFLSLPNEDVFDYPPIPVGTFVLIETDKNIPTFNSSPNPSSIGNFAPFEAGKNEVQCSRKEANGDSKVSICSIVNPGRRQKIGIQSDHSKFQKYQQKFSDKYDDNSLGNNIIEEREMEREGRPIQSIQPYSTPPQKKVKVDIISTSCLEEPLQLKPEQLQIQGVRSEREAEKRKGCICKKTQCLMMYCQCFKNGVICTEECSCIGCFNHPGNENVIEKHRKKRNSKRRVKKQLCQDSLGAFQIRGEEVKSCTCKNSRCQKRYCQCYNAGIACGTQCKCCNCQNPFQIQNKKTKGDKIIF